MYSDQRHGSESSLSLANEQGDNRARGRHCSDGSVSGQWFVVLQQLIRVWGDLTRADTHVPLHPSWPLFGIFPAG